HLLLDIFIGAIERRIFRNRRDLIESQLKRFLRGSTKLNDMAANLNSETRQQLFRDRATRDPRRGFARRRALQHIAQIVSIVLKSTGEIGMARPWTFHAPRLFWRNLSFVDG